MLRRMSTSTRIGTVKQMDIHYGPKMGDFLRASSGQYDKQIHVDEQHARTTWLHFYYLDPQPKFVV